GHHQCRSECAPMLRWMVGLLLVANAVYFAWTQGHLTALGFAPHEQSEPERLKAQIKPEALRLLNAPDPAEAPATPATPAAPTQVMEPDPAASAPEADTEEAPVEPEAAAAIEPPTACWQATGF